jgi:uncharacterized protein DUF3892
MVTGKDITKHGAGESRTSSNSARPGIDEKVDGPIGKSEEPAPSSAQERRDAALKGGGIVPRRKLPPLTELKKTPHTGGGSARPHAVKFHNPGDATNATTDTDHGSILYNGSLRVMFWGREWGSPNPPVTVSQVLNDVESIITGPYLDGLQQYGVSKPQLVQTLVLDNEDPPNPFDKDAAGNRIKDLIGDGNSWQFPRQLVMDLIRGGDQFKVDGSISHKESTVGIYYLDARHPYLATNTDGAPDDNLLALPQRRPS